MSIYSKYNAENVLKVLEGYIVKNASRAVDDVCVELSIFDSWVDRLSVAHMKQMRTFLKTAIANGYTGYVCFKVGARGCANGMWASTEESTDGYSPRTGKTLYRSFTPAYTYWSADEGNGYLPAGDDYDKCKTFKQLKNYLETCLQQD